jgi:ubiquinone/menaquinone biosynthesis C-methylase UbiE
LDVGCGQGDFCFLDPKKIIGIDMNTASLEKAKRIGCNVRFGDARKIPFAKLFFDGIFCAHIIEHFTVPDALKMLKEVHRVLKPGGILIIQTPLMHNAFYNNFTHEKVYAPEAIMRYLSKTNQTVFPNIGEYDVVKLIYRYAPLYNPVFEPKRLPDGIQKTILVMMKIISILFYSIGIRNYLHKDGYTLILRKK